MTNELYQRIDPMYQVMNARPGHFQPVGNAKAMPEREFLQKTLAAVKARRGLIHGHMTEGSRVCALGAFAKKHNNSTINIALANDLQQVNDSMPKASPATRRAKVIRWIERRLGESQ